MPDHPKTSDKLLSQLADLRRTIDKLRAADSRQKPTDGKLKESEDRFKTIFDYAPQGIAVLTPGGSLISVNPRFAEMFGYTPAEMATRTVFDLTHTEDIEGTQAIVRRLSTGDTKHAEIERRYIRKDGTVLWGDLTARAVCGPNDTIQALIGVVEDITDLRRAEAELEAAHNLLQTIIDGVSDPMVVVGTDYQVRLTNRAAQHWHNLPPGGDAGFCYELFHGRQKPCGVTGEDCPLELVQRSSQPVTIAHKHTVPDSEPHHVETVASPVLNADGTVNEVIVTHRDITDRKRAEEERRDLERRAQVASRLASVGQMASGIAHEINNPLVGVIGVAQLLMRKEIPDDIRGYVQTMYESAQRVSSIVSRLLSFARQDKPEQTLVDINDILESTVSIRSYAMRTNNIDVDMRLASDLAKVTGDARQLQQVFLNIIMNAETEMGSAHGRGRLVITTENVGETVRISFADNGPGIAQDHLDKLFDPFFTTRGVGKGTGLGLSICHGIVAEHNGRIHVRSQPGEGATFFLELPAGAETPPTELVLQCRQEALCEAQSRILVVDDEQVVLDFVEQALVADGHRVETAAEVNEAIERLETKWFGLILLDIKLPGVGGIELYEYLQGLDPSPAGNVVFMTGDIMSADTKSSLTATGAPYIAKPFNIETLKRHIDRMLNVRAVT